MNTQINIFTGHFTDNIEKKNPGVSFGAVIVRDSEVITSDEFSLTDSYLTLWLKSVLGILKQLEEVSVQRKLVPNLEMSVQVFAAHKNVIAISRKLQDIFDELKRHKTDVTKLLHVKLRRANRSFYDYHDTMVEIVTTLLAIHANTSTFRFQFASLPKTNPHMRTAQQHAEIVHGEANQASNVTSLFK